MKNIQILVAHHKPGYIVQDPHYLPIHVGKANSTTELGIQGDDTGENISALNPHFCELTAVYWAWKNLDPKVSYVGLCHYRRFFDFHAQSKPTYANHKVPENDLETFKVSPSHTLRKQLEEGHVILPKPHIHNISTFLDYSLWHNSMDLRKLEEIIRIKTPEYTEAFKQVIFKNSTVYPFNMFVMPRKWFDRYCRWLFDILFELQQQIDISHYTSYQQRVFGFLSERMMLVFVSAHNLPISTYPAVMFFPHAEKENISCKPVYHLKNQARKLISKLVSPQ